MARPMTSIKVVAILATPPVGTSGIIPMDYREGNFQCTVQVVVSGTGTYTVQYTADPINDTTIQDVANGGYPAPGTPLTGAAENAVNWFAHPSLTGVSANAISNIAFPVTAIRLIGVTFTSGFAFLRVLQTPVT
jgi:hypothetical protein